MSDEAAIRLFVADGGLAHEWHAQDQITRNHYMKLGAIEMAYRGSLCTKEISGQGDIINRNYRLATRENLRVADEPSGPEASSSRKRKRRQGPGNKTRRKASLAAAPAE